MYGPKANKPRFPVLLKSSPAVRKPTSLATRGSSLVKVIGVGLVGAATGFGSAAATGLAVGFGFSHATSKTSVAMAMVMWRRDAASAEKRVIGEFPRGGDSSIKELAAVRPRTQDNDASTRVLRRSQRTLRGRAAKPSEGTTGIGS